MWDPQSQTYTGGNVPSHHSAMDIEDLLALNDGKLKIFGYGSLCWHPGSDGVLSLANIEEDEHGHDNPTNKNNDAATATKKSTRKVTTAPGRAIGYQRCWSQRSADHRGTPEFNGIVCTLLSDEEVWRLNNNNQQHHNGEDNDVAEPIMEDGMICRSMTERLVYTVDVDLVDECLAELDFREKGGYARDVIDVVEDDTGNTVKALLYRGTPDNPAFWKRVLLDLPLAAAIMSVAIGPSGPNDVYLLHLHSFLTHAAQHSASAALALQDHSGDFHTGELANMVKLLQTEYRPYFLFGAGSNEHNQLRLRSSYVGDCDGNDAVPSENDVLDDSSEVYELTEMLLAVPRKSDNDNAIAGAESSAGNVNHDPKSLHAGGGHSALLTHGGDLYLWGWNSAGQLGRQGSASKSIQGETSHLLSVGQPLSNVKVESVDLGHTHTLVIEQETGRLLGFGENGRGQVNGCASSSATNDLLHVPQTPKGLSEECFIDVAAGLFHSAAITRQGELVTWGCGRFGQCLDPIEIQTQYNNAASTVGRWRPDDSSKLVQVTCGRRHTAVLDEHGRVWTLGDNKYGQLGRTLDSAVSKGKPQLVDGPLGQAGSGCYAICSGWSHILALTRDVGSEAVNLYGWGRNDKGQLGMNSSQGYAAVPQLLKPCLDTDGSAAGIESDNRAVLIQSACCGAESSHVLDIDGNIYSTGWNEHGNLAVGYGSKSTECCSSWMATSGVRVVAPPPSNAERKLFAAGGAHMIAIAISMRRFEGSPLPTPGRSLL
ncbi:hypothetical protein ACHAXR_005195 [Thalassiosira sp. AJA248-18]